MKDYEHYTIDDFILDESFCNWVKGDSGQEAFWLSFLDRFPDQQEAFRAAERFVRAASVEPSILGEGDIRRETERFIERTSDFNPFRATNPNRTLVRRKPPVWRSVSRGLTAVAALVLLVIFSRNVWQEQGEPLSLGRANEPAKHLVQTTNNTRQLLRVALSDGSEVWLSPKSHLRYPVSFDAHARIIYLNGEATFSVKRKRQPFLVYSGGMVTKVLGTRFVVRAFESDRKISVQVLSGKVSVYQAKRDQVPANNQVKGLILTANQAAIFEKSDGNLMKTVVANPAIVAKATQPLTFEYDEVPLPRILRELEVSYGIPIQFDEASFTASKITADLSNETLYQKLDLLCKAASASYEITDGQIVITRNEYQVSQ